MPEVAKVKLFNPQKRFALLVNRSDEAVQSNGHGYHRLVHLACGNRTLYQMSAALQRGSLDITAEIAHRLVQLGPEEQKPKELDSEAAAISRVIQEIYSEGGANIEKIKETFSGKTSKIVALQAFQTYWMANVVHYKIRSAIHYDQLRRVYPDNTDLRPEVYQILAFYQSLADENSLTLFFIRAHGEIGSIAEFEYSDLLDKMDKIGGKKAVIVVGSYSGSLIEIARARPRAEDYAVFSSTGAGGESRRWAENNILTQLYELVKVEKPLSACILRRWAINGVGQAANLYLPFDVIL